jgi:hypothetical protein
MKGSTMFVMLSALMVFCFGVVLAENGNMTGNMTMSSNTSLNVTENLTTPMNMTMPMAMPMKMPMNMTMPMKMPMGMPMGIPMGTPMNLSGGSSTNVIVLNNVTLNLILAQNLTEVNTIVLPSMTNETK